MTTDISMQRLYTCVSKSVDFDTNLYGHIFFIVDSYYNYGDDLLYIESIDLALSLNVTHERIMNNHVTICELSELLSPFVIAFHNGGFNDIEDMFLAYCKYYGITAAIADGNYLDMLHSWFISDTEILDLLGNVIKLENYPEC